MAQGEAPSSGLTLDQVRAVYDNARPEERIILGELLRDGTPREAMIFAQLLHYFPGSRVAEVQRPKGAALTEVVQEMFHE